MSPRRYRSEKRKEAAEETRRRIIDAVIALHAEQGVLKTTYALVAARADVAVPTVYNHFPKLKDMLVACFGLTQAQAPPLGPQIFEGLADLDQRIRALVRRLFAFYAYRGRWLRWTYYEAQLVPDMGEMQRQAAAGRRKLILLALAPLGLEPPPTLLALFEILLDFPAWQRLAQDPALPGDAAETTLADTLIALARGHAAAGAALAGTPRGAVAAPRKET